MNLVNLTVPIAEELKANGKTLRKTDREGLLNLYNFATGLDDRWSGTPSIASDTVKLMQQMAHLPFATVSSLTEIAIPLTRVSPKIYAKGLGKAIKYASGKMHKETLLELQKKHGLTREEAYREMHRVFLGIEQAVAQRIEGLYGEGMQSVAMRKIQNAFFKTNLRTQWTLTVKLA